MGLAVVLGWTGACGGDATGANANSEGGTSGEPGPAPTSSPAPESESEAEAEAESESATSSTDGDETRGGPDCQDVDCGPNGTCIVEDGGPTCACDDAYVPVEGECVSTEAWKLDEGHFVPAKMPMTLVHPRPDEETESWARNRVAHPDFRYEIPIGVQGGAWPFRYELTDGPPGASIGQLLGQEDYGVVTWDPTDAGSHTFSVRITDQDLETTTATWTVTVDPNPFLFVDGDDGDDGGVGTIDDPLRTFAGWYRDDVADDTYAGRILVFRGSSAPYLASGDPVNTDGNCRINSATKPVVWLGYPDETPVIDASRSKVFVEAPREDLYVAGLRFEHARADVANSQFFWVTAGGDRITFWRNTWYDLGPGEVGTDNPGPLFISGTGPEKRYILAKENLYEEIDNLGFNGHFLEVSRSTYVLVEQERARNSATPAGWYPKGAISHITVRNNTAIDNVRGRPIQGSFGGEAGELPHDHEFCWNNVRVEDGDGFLFSSSNAYEGQHHGGSVYRNTFVGAPWIRFEGAEPYQTDGNVVITSDPERWGPEISIHPVAEDLVASPADAVVDADNLLSGRARTEYLGLRGHEVH